ncbi:hypothetical protein [Neotamlana laminarinivorans]|uniref:Uncharacterized protein n=1 Tax=Neotamlana laminarinivorans TaxID=2883124 RepID=A0A9X1I198_9FLAO|nr:hypothetical protein [Tamlana laminarinivorans]MCB4799115.1 hypothetical protein [Tamlana laminarinivorans]
MLFLDPVYRNAIGATYLIKDNPNKTGYSSEKIQLFLGEVSIILTYEEVANLIPTIDSAKKGCACKNCKCEIPKQIKANTNYVKFIFKSSEKNILDLEDLVKGTLFELEMASVLSFNNID